jgi:glycosyltransferase involved in cell wall biosynthesis
MSPVVFFVPARDEAESVGDVVRRIPASVHGHPVVRLVVDDGSRDATAAEARSAGARVVQSHGAGLGAAVRVGLQVAVQLDPAAVVFCDADGEYAPEELAHVVEPILDGAADYVVGSRFAGEIRRMYPHRRAGNRLLTAVLARLARTPITDGQSGYRALSPAAARNAEIIHDYNYAQVLTLDLVAKGVRYAEVPISYSFREQGRSFVRLPTYLRRVVPAVWRELRTVPSVLDDVHREHASGIGPELRVDRAS